MIIVQNYSLGFGDDEVLKYVEWEECTGPKRDAHGKGGGYLVGDFIPVLVHVDFVIVPSV